MAADTAAAVSVGSAGFAWFGPANEVIQLMAGIVAIVAGLSAALYHFDMYLHTRRERKIKELMKDVKTVKPVVSHPPLEP
jgi:hypothetical protein